MQSLRIETLDPVKLVGRRIRTTLAENRTTELWRSFMPRRKEINNLISTDLYSVEVYDAGMDWSRFGPETPFDKWAAVAVAAFGQVPDGFDTLDLPGGLYAVFIHKGLPQTFPQTAQYIFGVWLPASGYRLADRPHFERMGERYSPTDPDSEEEVWIPIEPNTGAPGAVVA